MHTTYCDFLCSRKKKNFIYEKPPYKIRQVERNTCLLTLLRTKLVIVITACFYLRPAKYIHFYRKIFKYFFQKEESQEIWIEKSLGKKRLKRVNVNCHIRMKAQNNGPQRYMKLREELQVTETNKKGEKLCLKCSHLKRKVHSKYAMKAPRGKETYSTFILFL